MFNSFQHLRNQIYAHGLAEYEATIIRSAKPAIKINRERTNEDDIPIGASKLGGNPDLPADFEWPHRDNIPLTFIAQFSLADVAKAPPFDDLASRSIQKPLFDLEAIPTLRATELADFPEEGLLYFFYYHVGKIEPFDRDSWRIFYFDYRTDALLRVQHPIKETEMQPIEALPAHKILFEQQITLSLNQLDLLLEDHDPLKKEFAERSHIWSSTFDLWFEGRPEDPGTHHYLLGYATPIQGMVEWDAAVHSQQLKYDRVGRVSLYRYPGGCIANLDAEAAKWQFLFQIDTDDSLNVMWGDMGTLYICIPKISLRERRFEDCWTVFQCY